MLDISYCRIPTADESTHTEHTNKLTMSTYIFNRNTRFSPTCTHFQVYKTLRSPKQTEEQTYEIPSFLFLQTKPPLPDVTQEESTRKPQPQEHTRKRWQRVDVGSANRRTRKVRSFVGTLSDVQVEVDNYLHKGEIYHNILVIIKQYYLKDQFIL